MVVHVPFVGIKQSRRVPGSDPFADLLREGMGFLLIFHAVQSGDFLKRLPDQLKKRFVIGTEVRSGGRTGKSKVFIPDRTDEVEHDGGPEEW